MPIPTPNAGESQDDFIGRCMGNDAMQAEFPDQEQRAAVCLDAWSKKSALPVGLTLHVRSSPTGLYFKNYDAKTTDVDADKSTEVSIITTGGVDRDLEVVVSKGLRFPDHVTVLFNHNPEKPVGRKMWTKTHAGIVKAKTEYGSTAFAQETFTLVMEGILLQKSIGMNPGTMKRRQIVPGDLRKHVEWKGAETVIEGADILEYSVVSIAANPDAIRRAKNKGLIRLTAEEFPCLKIEPRITRVSMATVKRIRTVTPKVTRHRMGKTEMAEAIMEQWNVYRGVL